MQHEPRGLSGTDLVLALIAPIILVVVALVAIERYHRVDQSSWRGIGFGMFATYEYVPGRSARIVATFDGQERGVDLPEELQGRLRRVLVAPGDRGAVTLAEDIRRQLGADAVVLQLLGHDVDSTGPRLRITLKELRKVEVP